MAWYEPVSPLNLRMHDYQVIPTRDDEAAGYEAACDPKQTSGPQCKDQPQSHRYLSFVQTDCFRAVSAFVIFTNFMLIMVEAANPNLKDTLALPDKLMVCFYTFELICRALAYRQRLWSGPLLSTASNVLDCVVVLAGVLGWVLPIIFGSTSPFWQTALPWFGCLRLGRVLKMVRIFLETDLSWAASDSFHSGIGIAIALNALLMGAETDIKWDGWFFVEQIFVWIYIFELATHLKRAGTHFFSRHNEDVWWNLLDLLIVSSASVDTILVPASNILHLTFSNYHTETGVNDGNEQMKFSQVMMLVRMMRLLRILRLIKLVKSIRPLYILVVSLTSAVQGIVWVLVLALISIYALGILGTRLIGHRILFPPGTVLESSLAPFATVPDSMFTLFRMMSGAASAEESQAIDELTAKVPTVRFAFVFFMITASWTLLSILAAVVSERMISTTGESEYEAQAALDEEDRAQHIQDLHTLFQKIDVLKDGLVSEGELAQFLMSDANARHCARICRIPVRDVAAVFDDLLVGDSKVDMEQFTECLVDAGKPVTERSIMKLESCIHKVLRLVSDPHAVKNINGGSSFRSLTRRGSFGFKSTLKCDESSSQVESIDTARTTELTSEGLNMQNSDSIFHETWLHRFNAQQKSLQELIDTVTGISRVIRRHESLAADFRSSIGRSTQHSRVLESSQAVCTRKSSKSSVSKAGKTHYRRKKHEAKVLRELWHLRQRANDSRMWQQQILDNLVHGFREKHERDFTCHLNQKQKSLQEQLQQQQQQQQQQKQTQEQNQTQEQGLQQENEKPELDLEQVLEQEKEQEHSKERQQGQHNHGQGQAQENGQACGLDHLARKREEPKSEPTMLNQPQTEDMAHKLKSKLNESLKIITDQLLHAILVERTETLQNAAISGDFEQPAIWSKNTACPGSTSSKAGTRSTSCPLNATTAMTAYETQSLFDQS